MKYLLELAYQGTHYHGWQRQPGFISVQEVLEEALVRMLGQKVNCIGCGRTDAGVHASQFFGHIVVVRPFDFDPVFRLNKMLPEDISISSCRAVSRGFHAQHDATERSYTYRLHTRKNALLSALSTYYPAEGLDIDQLRAAVGLLTQYQDYRAFCKQPDLYKSTICQLRRATLEVSKDQEQLKIILSADRFLRGMVRLIVGNALEVGYGRLPLSTFEQSLAEARPLPYFKQAYPQGLYLSGVVYPNIEPSISA
ncbi:MAG: tRNA pseudouridine(38-40) synthase TruA [Bacteroidota bacterium]